MVSSFSHNPTLPSPTRAGDEQCPASPLSSLWKTQGDSVTHTYQLIQTNMGGHGRPRCSQKPHEAGTIAPHCAPDPANNVLRAPSKGLGEGSTAPSASSTHS